jgi:two-component system, OmpR family, response regulator MtrA
VSARILVVEDDASVREAVSLVLERAGYRVSTAPDGTEAIAALAQEMPDLVVLDVMLPGADGFSVCKHVRRTATVPIIMLTARAETAAIVTALELGADDYLTKPFEPAELAARIRAVLRRAGNDAPTTEIRDLRIDEAAFQAFKSDSELELTTIEMRLLAELVRNAGIVLTREVLLERVWGYDYLGDSRLVDMAIKRLRDKLGTPPAEPPYIATVRGVGYRFERPRVIS